MRAKRIVAESELLALRGIIARQIALQHLGLEHILTRLQPGVELRVAVFDDLPSDRLGRGLEEQPAWCRGIPGTPLGVVFSGSLGGIIESDAFDRQDLS